MAILANKKAIQLLGSDLPLACCTAPNQPVTISAACSHFQILAGADAVQNKKFPFHYFKLVNKSFDPNQILNPVSLISFLMLKGKHTLVNKEF